MSVAPAAPSVFLGATQMFTATVTNTTNTNVTWSVTGTGCTGAACGMIDAAGLYTAPQILPSPATVTVRATSVADTSRFGTATATIASDLAVSVAPSPASLELGAAQQFTETVTGSGNPNRNVTWAVSGAGCTAGSCGTITTTGLYTAPQILPSGGTMPTITATSVADASKQGTSTVTVTSSFTLSVSSPNSAIDNGTTEQFTATLTPVMGSNPSPSVTWSVAGASCQATACGMVDGTGLYTAPLIAPSPDNQVTITATSVADPSKTASKTLTINAVVNVFITPSPSVNVNLEAAQQFSATVGGTLNQSVIWFVDNIIGGDQATVGAITNPDTGPATYFAPVNMPAARMVTVKARSDADPNKEATVTVNLGSAIAVLVSPSSSTRAVNRRVTLFGEATNTMNKNLEWRVNGVVGGNSAVGLICVSGFSPCTQVTTPTNALSVDYEAPASVPGTNPVAVTATSQADPLKSGNAQVTVIPNVQVSVSPQTSTLPPNTRQQMSATVVGTSDLRVSWAVNGVPNGDATVGQICVDGSNPCMAPSAATANAVDYLSPASAPPNPPVGITATSADGGQSGTAAVTIATGAFIRTLRPSSITAGPAGSFTLRVIGINFSTGAPGATILLEGVAKPTACATADANVECTAVVSPSEVATAGNRGVQIRNADNSVSNQVSLVAVVPATTEDAIPLSTATPAAVNQNFSVVEPTTAGDAIQQVNLDAIGIIAGNACSLRGSPITLQRPPSGTASFRICVGGTGLSALHTYTLSGPTPNDITLSGVQLFGGGVAIEMTLTLSSTTQPGLRTLFVETANKEKSSGSGLIEVK